MNNTFKKIFAIIALALFVGAFFWIGDAHSFLDSHFWHFVDRKPSPFDLIFLPLSWVAAFILAEIPFLVCGIVIAHFHDLEIKKEEEESERLNDAKKASNLYIKTSASAPAEERR